jgi:phosphatidylinositol 3,5-bisphosphate 5-phosphatase
MKDSRTKPSDQSQSARPAKADKALATQQTLEQFVKRSLDPSVGSEEAEEYERYIRHPLTLPLVVSTETPPNPSLDFLKYVNSVSREATSTVDYATEEDIAEYEAFLTVSDNPLTVGEDDAPKKRYKAYRQWLKGKSLFKNIRVDQ